MTESEKAPINGTAARPYIGGQAVLEGVMMRAPSSFAVVVRRADGSLHVRERAMKDERSGWARLPFIRGVTSLVESLRLGSESLKFSAELFEKDMEAEDEKREAVARRAKSAAGTNILSALTLAVMALTTTQDGEEVKAPAPAKAEKSEKKKSSGTLWFMLLVVIVFFIALPQAAAMGINGWAHLNLDVQSPAFQLITGALKLCIVVGYLTLIRRVPDIRRVFQYHGAEHKTISTYEANETLTVPNARAKTTLHPRCGTTFLVMVALVSILVFTAVGSFLPRIQTGNTILDNVVFFFEKLPFLPVITAVTFELQRIFARYCTTGPLRALLWPGFLVQKITTIEPDDHQLEVALASLRVTLFREEGIEKSAEKPADVRYATFDSLMKSGRLRSPARAAA